MPKKEDQSQPVVVKKYANRRLYNTATSSYVTLEHLAGMVRDGIEFQVVDAKTGEDITGSVLTQIIVEEEARGQTLLPISFLRQLISMYGDSLQSMVPHYLEASMEAFQRNQTQFRKAMEQTFSGNSFNPLEQFAKQNMAMFQAATDMFAPKQPASPRSPEPSRDEKQELRALKEQLAALQSRLDKLTEEKD